MGMMREQGMVLRPVANLIPRGIESPHVRKTGQVSTRAATTMHDAPLTLKQFAARAGISPSTIRRNARTGNCPSPRRYGPRSLRWDAAEVELWLHDPAAWRAAEKAKQL